MPEKAKFMSAGLSLSFDELVERLIEFVKEQPQREYKIVVGTDSKAEQRVRFVTAVAILRVRNGARYFWTRSEEFFVPTLRDRIYKETMYSIAFTQELRSRLKDKLGEEFFWDGKISVHLDVGQNGPTKELIDAVVGMVRGYGLEAVIKPDSFGAFVVADRHT
ncbi:hypothetical protein A2757_03665 [Candidatus Giovannonibacteria bacterium RIFCSPHIGHO2_01_FULL_48_47]|nr:MAG: hypothetical protein A2757_03665 [Candidatus Giovannonibacteria bacterium RIFCSPHIGHO2_01_FULL_48_47]OGF68699.1 MAG: hypothetical protein A3D61_01250 [Candidatus Giovannonibacteria bacterium RIFCSPHIGHO2_02_FULL_48_15]OGF89615.1 MAG: hypothetical protein A3B26_02675 [Candidatus Giovannonibacteria bacterium RIFCSPLOWO2_01_FULL_48_47]OGF96368.1 MAG: hypothetical protein A2613_02290 [Candidatus Giovannonibacteria bacterium RIFOXYD1_FULL_48_21]HBT81717.1 hypothetical protein [Candidatus Gio